MQNDSTPPIDSTAWTGVPKDTPESREERSIDLASGSDIGAVAVLRAGIAAIPLLGGSINEIWNGFSAFSAEKQNKRRDELYIRLSAKIDGVQEKLDYLLTSTDEGYDFAGGTFQANGRTGSLEKREAFANILAKGLDGTIDLSLAPAIVYAIDSMSALEMTLLAELLKDYVNLTGKMLDREGAVVHRVSDNDMNPYGFEPKVARIAIASLVSKGILYDHNPATFNGGTNCMDYTLTELGRTLKDFMADYHEKSGQVD